MREHESRKPHELKKEGRQKESCQEESCQEPQTLIFGLIQILARKQQASRLKNPWHALLPLLPLLSLPKARSGPISKSFLKSSRTLSRTETKPFKHK